MTARAIASLPQPRGLPLLGNALQLRPDDMHLSFEAWVREFGPLYRIRLGPREALVVAEPEAIRQALRERPEGFRRLSTFESVTSELGVHGLFSAEGAMWREQRRIWLQSLSVQQIKAFHGQLQKVTARLLRRWQTAADQGEVLDIAAELMRYTVDVTMLFTLGTDANTLEKGEDVIQRHLNLVFPIAGRRLASPFPYWRYFRLPSDRAADAAIAALRKEVGALIAAASERLRAEPERRNAPGCFLEALLVAREAEGTTLTDADVFANCLTVLLAGEDTTANTLAWLIHYCCAHPQTYAGIRVDADALLDAEGAPDPDVPSASRFPHTLAHTDAALNETLRLSPVTPTYFLTALQATTLAGVAVPAGTDVILLVRPSAGSMPGATPAPQFSPAPGEAIPGNSPTLPFGFGPRVCPGRNLAVAELRSAALMLARNFDLEAVPGKQPVRELLSFTLVPQHLRVRLHRRRR